jgi:uncharacterized membrane protein YozB (DUF420 family)
MDIYVLPTLNALFNGLSFIFLICGFIFIRKGDVRRHRIFMLSAVASSALFLTGYLIYHSMAGTTRFAETGWPRVLYFFILTSHTILAMITLPMAIATLILALKKRFDKHPRIARITLPIWLYVSITGVLIYLMLYHIFPSR